MRIISGKYRARIIKFPKTKLVRPMQDRVRESLFNILTPIIQGSVCLDLFSGSGSLGIEALSRGAEEVTFVDNNRQCINIIKDNLKKLNAEKQALIYQIDAQKAISRAYKLNKVYDIVFIDAPFYKGIAKKILIKLGQYDILSQCGIVAAQHFTRDVLPDNIDNIVLYRRKEFSDKIISFYKKRILDA